MTPLNPVELFWWLLVGHALGDFVLQTDAIAQRKNHRTNPMPAVPWYYWLGAHALVHGGIVALVTGSIALGVIEVWCHAMLDWAKCDGRSTLNEDQLAHVACKVWWVLCAWGAASFGAGIP